MNKLDDALNKVELTYNELVEVANDMTSASFKSINELINKLNNNIQSLSLDMLRTLLLDLSVQAFSLSDIKDKAALKQEVSETLRKEKYATKFNLSDGTIATRENNALLESSEEYLVELIYNLVASAFKTKLDEIHRLISTITTIIMSRMTEMKVSQTTSIGDVGESTYLKE